MGRKEKTENEISLKELFGHIGTSTLIDNVGYCEHGLDRDDDDNEETQTRSGSCHGYSFSESVSDSQKKKKKTGPLPCILTIVHILGQAQM